MAYSIEKIVSLIGARKISALNDNVLSTRINWLLTDSRSLAFPEETLFFALKSDRNDGHRFIEDLYHRGVRNFVVETLPNNFSKFVGCTFLQVKDSLKALQRLAERHRDEFNIPIVGITGSNDKTKVKEWLYQLLSPSFKVTRSPRSYNSQIGVPLSVWLLDENTEVGVFEAGISLPNEMFALHDIIQPTIGLLTNLGIAHQENFSSQEEKCAEKLRLFKDADVVIFNGDDKIVNSCIGKSHFKNTLSWSRINEQQVLYIKSEKRAGEVTLIEYRYKGKDASYSIPFIDDASLECSINCCAVCLYMGLSPELIRQRMAQLEPVGMRLEVKEGRNGCTLINDSYNSDFNSLDMVLDFMGRRLDLASRHRTLILSDIYQSGEDAEMLYSKVGALLAERKIEHFIGIGDDLCRCSNCIRVANKVFFKDVEDFLLSPTFFALQNEVILIKGARKFGFERITEQLVEKVHETTLEVNLKAIVANLNYYRSFLHSTTKLVCMIKASAYGAGSVEVAKILQDQGVDYLAVAVADEGVELRKNGICSNIMVMNPEMSSLKTLFDYKLEPEVYSFRLLDALIKEANKKGITNYPMHIKIDTGMHRLGFNPKDDMEKLIARLISQTALMPRSVFSHFVGSDSDTFDEFSAHQFNLFQQGSSQLQNAFHHKILRHMDNSAGIEHFPQRQMEMCRLGLGLYGINPRNNVILNNVSTLRTTILQIRHVPKDETVGYSRKGTLSRDSIIAVIPIGYADGLNRRLGNRNCYCLVNGQRAEYVGNICMDVAMIDVTGIECHEGDSVEIFGDNLPITVLSDALGTIPYEIITGISNRVKRIYFQD